MPYLETLITEEEIKSRVAQLGARITEDFEGKKPLLICVLRGACVFFADLIRKIETPMTLEFTAVSSYAGGLSSTGKIRLLKEISSEAEGRHVIIVEDIIDSGLTIEFLKGKIEEKKPASVSVCALLDKPSGRKTDVECDYTGFEIADEFVVGYGMDLEEIYRNLPKICVMKETR